jgi:hypothetical protein
MAHQKSYGLRAGFRLGLLRPTAKALAGALVNPKFPPPAAQAQDIEDASRAVGQRKSLSLTPVPTTNWN